MTTMDAGGLNDQFREIVHLLVSAREYVRYAEQGLSTAPFDLKVLEGATKIDTSQAKEAIAASTQIVVLAIARLDSLIAYLGQFRA